MRIFLAGGTGVVGSRLIPALTAAGHQVTATTLQADRVGLLTRLGATPAIVDVNDAPLLTRVVAEATPDLVMNEVTDFRNFDTDANARLRRSGTTNLVAAARAAEVDRIVLSTIVWVFPDAPTPASEADPINPGSPADIVESIAHQLPHATILRFGRLYGPGTRYGKDGDVIQLLAAGELRATSAITVFVHIDDAVAAAVQALEWPDGTYHIVDDDPAPGTAWLPALARAFGLPPPAAPLSAGTRTGRAISNAKARAQGWTPKYPSWRQGFG